MGYHDMRGFSPAEGTSVWKVDDPARLIEWAMLHGYTRAEAVSASMDGWGEVWSCVEIGGELFGPFGYSQAPEIAALVSDALASELPHHPE